MKRLDSCSGPWVGLSTQASLRISEKIQLSLSVGILHGTGSDLDGDFVLDGKYDSLSGDVEMARRYTLALDRYTRKPKRDFTSVLVLYDYTGRWDGEMISGTWQQRDYPPNQGTFEMWPYREEEQRELAIESQEDVEVRPLVSTGPG
ncbi:MAG: hypothetical protein ACOYON_09225 [Fimbriimonas sp.]